MIVNQGGIPLFSQSYEKGMDCCTPEHHSVQSMETKSHLFSGFITAISGMATEFNADLKQLNMGEFDIFLENKHDLKAVLVAKTDSDYQKQKEYRNATEVIMDKFHEQFGSDITNFNGNVDKFRLFGDSLRNLEILDDGTISTPLCRSCISELKDKFER